MLYPVSLNQRIDASEHIVLGKLVAQESYWDAAHFNIYTLNTVEVTAYLKGAMSAQQVAIITMGGVVGDRAQITTPSLELAPYNEYVLFLGEDNHTVDNRAIRQTQPSLYQAETYADAQGAITKQGGIYHDLRSEPEQNESALFAKIADRTGQQALTPHGQPFLPRLGDTFPLSEYASIVDRQMPITSFTPSPTNAGTIVPADFITITGSGFGAAPGTVFYTNADDGGATFTSSGVPTDNVAWSATSIQNKVARAAGTGPINVNGAMTSGTNLAIDYSHINITSNFSGFAGNTRQRYYLLNKNGTGGYTFIYNTAFSTNAPAVAAFERALNTWRCATFVNFNINKASTSPITSAVLDGVNLILFDATLPVGVLGRATSRFNGQATGGCTLTNTIWWVDEIDVQYFPDPPSAGFPWNYGPGASGFTNYDFESVTVHELGHGHGLGHVIAAGTVMHFGLANGSDVRNLGGNDIAGGNAKMGYSVGPLCFTPATTSGAMIALTAGTCTLPVEFLSFTGQNVPGVGNRIEWTLSQEHGNQGFEVERSADGVEFEPLGFVQSFGNSTAPVNYSFMDRHVGSAPVYFYRLQQLDLNGQHRYSNTIEVAGLVQQGLAVLPTQFSDHFVVTGVTTAKGNLQLDLFNAQGDKVLSQSLITEDGGVNTTVLTQSIASGIYLFRISSNYGQVALGKVVKQ
jgi:hypothetical protein